VILFFIFLVIFPKGGIKLFNIPLTWGYLLAGITFLFAYPIHVRFVEKNRLYCLLALLPFQIVCTLSICILGIENYGFTAALFVSFIFIPLFAFLCPVLEWKKYTKLLKHSLFYITAYGLFLFFYKLGTGKFIEIPFLTINYHDIGQMELTKCIDRGGFFKLISTYNNGNIFGICMLMLLPLYQAVEKRRWRILLLKLALLLTLSRTIWLGLIFLELFAASRHRAVKLTLSAALIALIVSLLPFNAGFLLDPTFGARSDYFAYLSDLSLFGSIPFEGVCEITYLGILKSFGTVGLATFLLAMWTPIVFARSREGLWGLVCYNFISLSDGALLYVPTLFFYWMLSALAMHALPSEQESSSARA
jgi:hypothetical protein